MWWQTQPISLSEMMPELHQSTDNCKHLDSARPEKAVLQFYSVEIHVLSICGCKCPCILCFVECLAYSCFTQLMKRMSQNFPNGGAMDAHFANMRSLIQVMDHTLIVWCVFWMYTCMTLQITGLCSHQILDSELFELMHQNGDYTHFYFCYRWFLLDFKRGESSYFVLLTEASRAPPPHQYCQRPKHSANRVKA